MYKWNKCVQNGVFASRIIKPNITIKTYAVFLCLNERKSAMLIMVLYRSHELCILIGIVYGSPLKELRKITRAFYSSEPFTCHELGISLTLNESVGHRLLLCNKTSTFNLYSDLCSNFVFIYCLCIG